MPRGLDLKIIDKPLDKTSKIFFVFVASEASDLFFRSFIFNGTPCVLIRLHGFAKVWRRRRRRRRFQGGEYSSLTAALIDLIFGMHTPIRSIGVVGYMNLTFEVIKGHLWEIFTKTSDVSRSFWTVETFFFFYSQLKVKGALKFGI